MDDETAEAFASEEFERRYPRETWPEWLRPCTIVSYTRDPQGRFVVSFAVWVQEPLRPDEHWEEKDKRKHIVRVDPATQERSVVYRTPHRAEVYFKAAVDPDTAAVTVLIDRDVSTLSGKDLVRGP